MADAKKTGAKNRRSKTPTGSRGGRSSGAAGGRGGGGGRGGPRGGGRGRGGHRGRGKGRVQHKVAPPPPIEEEPSLPLANSRRRYDRIEMAIIRMELAVNHARVLSEAWQRWEQKPRPCPIPPPAPPKDPVRAQMQALAEHKRRLGRAAETGKRSTLPSVAMRPPADLRKKEMAPDSGLATVTTMDSAEESKAAKAAPGATEPPADPCQRLHEPCRRLFTAPCRPCPEHMPGVPRDPKKICTCTMTPRPETRKDALRFLSLMPRELHATYSSLDPARLEEERQRKKAEAKWRFRLEAQQQRFEKAMRRARALVEAQVHVPKPPFVAEYNTLTFARGMATNPLLLVCCEPNLCKS